MADGPPTAFKKRKADSTAKRAAISKKTKIADPVQSDYTVQTRACIEYETISAHSLCVACAEVSLLGRRFNAIRQVCRFIGFRMMKPEDDGRFSMIFRQEGVPRAEYEQFEYYDWNPSRTADHKAVIKVRAASFCNSRPYFPCSILLHWLCCRS